ncbi:MAG TPA: hypothetical protein VJ875_06420 [Pyrinomonadaceae bacterium]|nr:hypothetical protein [Pyrinomonadaceae bacterium]
MQANKVLTLTKFRPATLIKRVLYGLIIGHADDQLTPPLGVTATLDATNGIVDITEAAVV